MRFTLLPSLILCAALLAACGRSGAVGPADDADMSEYNQGLPAVGSTLPAIAAATLDGKAVTNASLHGKTILLNLWFFH